MNNAKQAGEAVALASMHHGAGSSFTEHIREKAHSLGYHPGEKGSKKRKSIGQMIAEG